jgi:hypothetical protein
MAALAIVTLFASIFCFAADPHAAPAPAAAAAPSHATTAGGDGAHAPAANQAVLPPPGIRWPAVMLIIVLGMFLAAMVVGPVVRINMPEEVPITHAHDESYGHDHGGHHH